MISHKGFPRPPPPPPPRNVPPQSPRPPSTRESRWQRWLQRVQRVAEFLLLHELPWLHYAAPPLLRPDFTSPHQVLVSRSQLSTEIPAIPTVWSPTWLWFMGRVHSALCEFSRYYCAWFGVPHSYSIVPLPFGLLLKWSDGTSLDEARSMAVIRAAGIPAPRVISVGEQPETPWAPVSILMTRLPGEQFDEVYDDLEPTQRNNILAEWRTILDVMRSWKSPWDQRVCSVSGGCILSIRVPNHSLGPCESEAELNDYLLAPASSQSFKTEADFQTTLATARKMYALRHMIVFTHGDLALHNTMVHDGHISGFIDWESAGWYPEYWEFTTPLRWPSRDREGGALFLSLGGGQYRDELEAEMALMALTVDSWIFI